MEEPDERSKMERPMFILAAQRKPMLWCLGRKGESVQYPDALSLVESTKTGGTPRCKESVKSVNNGNEFGIYSKCSEKAVKNFKQTFHFDWHQHHVVKSVKNIDALLI